ncbi:MAG: XRE family transcriptional regulator [Pseudonocardiaceae bacterium]
MATANTQFRAARERTASPTSADDCLSRQELADLVNAWIWTHHDKKKLLTASYIGKLEQGSIRWPGILYREAFRAIFGVSTDSALGFVNARRKVVKLDNVKRRQFNHTAVGVGALAMGEPFAALLGDSEPTPVPARVGATDIEHVRTATEVFSEWLYTYGGGLGREAAMAQLRWSAGLLDATCPDELRPELFSAVGALANIAGYMSFEVYAHDDASRAFGFALYCAQQAEDWNLRAHVLTDMAARATWIGRPDEGLTWAEEGLVRADRLSETVQAMLHTDRGRALAKMRRVEETRTALGMAEEHFARSTPTNDPPILANYNAAFLAGNTGAALFDLAMLGHSLTQATDRLTTAAAGHTAVKPQAHALIKLASLTMATGDPLQAAAIGHAALDRVGKIRSRRTAEHLRELSGYAAAHQHLDEVAHLRYRIATLVCIDNP